MKKFILDKDTDKLIPWSEYIHEKKEVDVSKDDKKSDEDSDSRSIELSQEAKKTDSSADKAGAEAQSTGSEVRREIYPEPDKSGEKVKEEVGESDKVVVTKEDSGPPGVIEKKKKKKVKRKVSPLDVVDGGDKKKSKKDKSAPTAIFYKRPWISL